MRCALANVSSNAGAALSAPRRVGCHCSCRGPNVRSPSAPRYPSRDGYREVVLDDDEDYTEAADDENDDVDGEPGAHADPVLEGHAEPAPIERFHRTSVGMVLAAGMFGLRDVLETPKDNTPAIVEDWAGGQPVRRSDRAAARSRQSRRTRSSWSAASAPPTTSPPPPPDQPPKPPNSWQGFWRGAPLFLPSDGRVSGSWSRFHCQQMAGFPVHGVGFTANRWQGFRFMESVSLPTDGRVFFWGGGGGSVSGGDAVVGDGALREAIGERFHAEAGAGGHADAAAFEHERFGDVAVGAEIAGRGRAVAGQREAGSAATASNAARPTPVSSIPPASAPTPRRTARVVHALRARDARAARP